jgi:hypothetical protein
MEKSEASNLNWILAGWTIAEPERNLTAPKTSKKKVGKFRCIEVHEKFFVVAYPMPSAVLTLPNS